MTRISLIGTVHEESGRANVSALVAILERIRPEVIFLELPTDAFEDEHHPAHDNLESTAVRQYRANHQVTLEPVDLPEPEEHFLSENRDFYRQIMRTSHQFSRLMDLHSKNVSAYGFTYLNSAACAKFWSDLHHETLETIAWTGRHTLNKHYREWMQTHESGAREPDVIF